MWIDKLVGDFADKKSYLELPRCGESPRALMYMGPSDDGRALIAMLNDLAELFEQSVADATPIRTLVGSDVAAGSI